MQDLSGSLTLDLNQPSGLAIVDGWFVVGQENGDVASFVRLDPSSGIAEEIMSPLLLSSVDCGNRSGSESWIGSPNQVALYVSGLTGEVELLNFSNIRDGNAASATSRSNAFFEGPVGTMTESPEAMRVAMRYPRLGDNTYTGEDR